MGKNEEETIDGHKLISVFYELSKPSFSASDDTILDKLYDNLIINVSVKELLNSGWPEIGNWLETVVKAWNTNELFHGVKIFALRFIGFVGSTPKGFTILHTFSVLRHVQELITNTEIQNDSCIMQPLINILNQFLSHQDGWKWIIETIVWRNIVKVLYEDGSIFVKKAGVTVLSLLLRASANYDRDIGTEILRTICEPLIVNNIIFVESLPTSADKFTCQNTSCESNDKWKIIEVSRNLINCAKLLCDVLQDLLLKNASLPGKLSLVTRISKTVESVIISDILYDCTSAQDCQTFVLLLLMVELSNLSKKDCCNLDSNPCPLAPVYARVKEIIKSLASQGHCFVVSNFCVTCLSWQSRSKYSKDCYNSSCRACFEFESSIVYCLTTFLHLHSLSFSCCGISACIDKSAFGSNLSQRASVAERTLGKSLFNQLTVTCMSEKGHKQKLTFQYIQSGIFALTRSLEFIQDANVEMIFLDVLLSLKTMIKLFKSHKDLVKPVLLHLLPLTRNLTEKCLVPFFNKSKESDENIFEQIMEIVDLECSDIRVTVAALQTLNTILKSHILPDLMKNIEMFDKLTNLRNQLHLNKLELKLSSESWEVRDTTLEVFQSMVELAEITPWFFMDPSDRKLFGTVLNIASNDESTYVRASALNFLTRLVRAKLLNSVTPEILTELGIKTLLEDNMPSARRAACDLLNVVNIDYLAWCSDLEVRNKIYEAVYQASVKDLDWEVKKAALVFWHSTVCKYLLEGKVPLNPSGLCLSKHPRSIEDIRMQIVTIFHTLGEIGCLKAIWLCLIDDANVQGGMEAQEIVKYFEKLDEQWNFINCLTKESNNHDRSENPEQELTCQKLDCSKFFDLLRKSDWREKLMSRNRWIKNEGDDLTSLMDLILNVDNGINDWDHNILDCY